MTAASHPEVGAALGLLILGALLTVPNVVAIWRGLRSTGWRSTRGKITADGWSVDAGYHPKGAGPMYGPVVRYQYTVEGVTYQGRRVSFARSVSVLSRWTTPLFRPQPDIRAGLRTNDLVEVWYDPARPADAVLRPGVSFGFWCLALAGIVTLCLGVLLALIAYALTQGPIG